MKINDLDDFLKNRFIDNNATFKRIVDDDYGSEPKCEKTIPLNRILRLSLTDEEKKYALKFLKENGVIVKGTVENMNFESEDYEIVGLNRGKIPTSISQKDTEVLFEEYNSTKNPDIRKKIILGNMRLVYNVLISINRDYNYDYCDLVQAGYIGLIKAVDKYNMNIGSFSTFATSYIKGYILKEVYNEQGIKISCSELYKKIKGIEKEYGEKISDNPRLAILLTDRLAEEGNKSKNFYNSCVRKIMLLSTQSLEEVIENDEEEKENFYHIGYEVEDNDINYIYDNEIISTVKQEIATLKEKKQEILRLYYGIGEDENSLEKIGNKLGLTRQGAAYSIDQALGELKRKNKIRSLKNYLYKEV